MSHVHDKAIAEAESKLVLLLSEANGIPGLVERVALWIERMCSGRKLSEYLHDATIPGKDRVTVAQALVEILLTKAYERLPSDPSSGARPVDPSAVSSEVSAGADAQPASSAEEFPPASLPPELSAAVQREVRLQLAQTFETIAKVLRETA